MITATVEGAWRQKLTGLLEELKAAGVSDCIIKPTKVLYELSRMKGRAVLEIISQAAADKVKREQVPYVERAIEGRREGWEQRVARAYRRWAYRFIEELLVEVRDKKRWGTVTSATTLALKSGDGVEKVGNGVPPDSWGVRHTRPDWRRIQKGQAQAGKKRPTQTETEKKIIVLVDGREVS